MSYTKDKSAAPAKDKLKVDNIHSQNNEENLVEQEKARLTDMASGREQRNGTYNCSNPLDSGSRFMLIPKICDKKNGRLL